MSHSFYNEAELKSFGFESLGKNVKISRNASIYFPENLRVGNNTRIDDFCVISAGGGISIGDYVHIAPYCGLYGGAGIELQDFSGLSSRVSLYSVSDDFTGYSLVGPCVPEKYRRRLKKGKITLGKFVVVGVASSILPGVSIETGAAIGAHTLVTRRCEQWSIYSGNPAEKVGRRSDKMLGLADELLREKTE